MSLSPNKMFCRISMMADDLAGFNVALGSRLVPATAYKNATLVGQVYSELLNAGTLL